MFNEEEGGRYSLSLELETLTSNANSIVQDSKNVKYTFEVKAENLPYIKKYGIDLSMYLPVKKPGAYYVRAAIKDRISGKIGSAYQFLEIPDLQKRRLALSSLFAFRHEDDVAGILSGEIGNSDVSCSQVQEWEVLDRSSVPRVYHPGEEIRYFAMLYNAGKLGATSQLGSQVAIFKDGKEIYRGITEKIDMHSMADPGRIPIRGKFLVDGKLDSGLYVLELRISDKKSEKSSRTAVQDIDFEVSKGQ